MDSESSLYRFIAHHPDKHSKLTQLQKLIEYCIDVQRPPQFSQDLPLQTIFYEQNNSWQRTYPNEEITIQDEDTPFLSNITNSFKRDFYQTLENRQENAIFIHGVHLQPLQ
ncbi:hypothetical protein SS50377_20098 [Spironucleus salmonicida]|uniref:Uncharacterized protein n=1 Tax=Spironucleus salmonicida TaxID=348837 RepID=V6LKJ3_9EUKA|nr:hypothetical protein SS50377_20098 [Spironucleus salmonicida]|eukprot:EST45155.1 Hypothetical protein SS50377_14727 [Spironucleus salmonicida]